MAKRRWILPLRSLSETELAITPFKPDCDSQTIICDGDLLPGQVGASYESLIRSAETLATAFADPELMGDLKLTLQNAAVFTESATVLSQELTGLSRQVQTDLGPLMASANRATDNIGTVANQVGDTASVVSGAAAQFEIAGAEVNQLIASNRSSLVGTLGNLNRSTAQLETILATLSPAIQDSQLLANLDRLSADATVAMADIRAITTAANTPENLVMLQQTLDSARNVFQSAHKVLADVDELTGDPALRNNIRNLVNGLSNLVSLTNELEQNSRLAQALTLPQGAAIGRVMLTPAPPPNPQANPQPANSGPLLITHNGQYYRLQTQAAP